MLVDALGVDDEEVTPQATMVGDLVSSRLTFWTSFSSSKKRLRILHICEGSCRRRGFVNASFVIRQGYRSRQIAELKKRMPFVDFTKFESNPQVRELPYL